MPKKVINAFNAGEVSPYVYARQDSELYDKACLKMENFLPLEYGGATKRPAAKFVHKFENTTAKPISATKLYSFVLNAEETYVLAFTNLELSIFKNNELIGTFDTVFTDDCLSKLKFVQSNDVLFISSEKYPIQILKRIGDNAFAIEELKYKYPPLGNPVDDDIVFTADSPTGRTTLTTNGNYFRQEDIGSFLILEQRRDLINSSTCEFLDHGSTRVLNTSFSNYEVEVNGKNFQGKVLLEKSTDGGETFEIELTLVDTSGAADSTDGQVSANYHNRTFSSTEAEGANTFIRLRYLPEGTGGSKCTLRIKILDPVVKGLFQISTVGSSTAIKESNTSTGVWISPIQDVEAYYSGAVWDGTTEYKKNDKVIFTGTLTADSGFGTKEVPVMSTSDINASSGETEIRQKFIDMTYSGATGTDYMYFLTNDDRVVRYTYNLSTGALSSPMCRSLSYTDQYTGSASGKNTEAGQAHFGIAALESNIYVVLRDAQSGSGTESTKCKINKFTETNFAAGDINDARIESHWSQDTLRGLNIFNIHGLGVGGGYFYFKVQQRRVVDGEFQNEVKRFRVDENGRGYRTYMSGSHYGKSSKTTKNGSHNPRKFGLSEEPEKSLPLATDPTDSDHIFDGAVMERDQLDTVYLNGYLLCLDDKEDSINFRSSTFGDLGLTFSLGSTKSFQGLALVPKIKKIGTDPLVIGNTYEITTSTSNSTQLANVRLLGYPKGKDYASEIKTFVATATGIGDVTLTNVGTGEAGIVELKIVQSSLPQARDVDIDIIIFHKDQDGDGDPKTVDTSTTDNNAPRIIKVTSKGEPNYYQATRDFPSPSDDPPLPNNFYEQFNKGLWSKSFPKIIGAKESAYTGYYGYPNSISIFENRLCLGGSKKFPNRLWMSKTDDLNNFLTGAFDTDALDLTFNSLTQDQITWLCSGRELNIGTMSSEWTLGSGNQSLPVTPTQLNLKRRSEYGSSKTQATLVNSAILFLMRQGKKLREWYLRDNQNDYLAQDLSAIAEHITGDGIVDIAVQNQPTTIIWLVREDGDLISLTYERETKTFAWAKHTFEGDVESVTVIPQENGEDKVYLSIKRKNELLTKDNVVEFHITIESSREQGDGQVPLITADATKHVTASITHGSPTPSAIVLPVNHANGVISSPSISNISTDVYGFKGRIKSFTPNNDRIHIVPETITVSGATGNATTLVINGTYTLGEDIFNQPAWYSETHTIQVNQELAINPSTGFAYSSSLQGSDHDVKWQIRRKSDSLVIVQHAYTNDEFPARGNGTTTWSHNQSGSGTVLLAGDGYPFTSDHIGLPLVYLNLTTAPNRTPDIGGLTHGTTYYLREIIGSGDDQTLNRILRLQSSGNTSGTGTLIDITNNSEAIKTQTEGVFNLKNHFLASAAFATPRINAFQTGVASSSHDTLYNVGSPSTNANFVKTVSFNDGEICGFDVFLWNAVTSGSKEGNDLFIKYEGDPAITIDNTEAGSTQTKVSFTYDVAGKYNIDLFISDASESTTAVSGGFASEITTLKSGEGTLPVIADDRYLVELDPQKHESSYKQKYSGLDFYVRSKNFSGTSFTGLDHLENKTVTYKVDGVVTGTATVSSGAITISSVSNANVIAGLPFTSTLAPLYLDAEGSMGSKKSAHHATIRFKDTLEAKVGQTRTGTHGSTNAPNLGDVKFASSNSLNTEDTEVWLANHNEFLQTIYVVSDTPQPCTVLAMVVDVEGV